jgi:hypothetical protein
MGADISIWQKPGHFYFALTRRRTAYVTPVVQYGKIESGTTAGCSQSGNWKLVLNDCITTPAP